MREIEITPDEYQALRALEVQCSYPALTHSGLELFFDEMAWVRGVRSILEERAPEPDFQVTRIKVVIPTPQPEPKRGGKK